MLRKTISHNSSSLEISHLTSDPFMQLSDEMLLMIARYLPLKALSLLAMTNMKFHLLLNDSRLPLKKYKENALCYKLGNLYLLFKMKDHIQVGDTTYAHCSFKIMEAQDLLPELNNTKTESIRRGMSNICMDANNKNKNDTFERLVAAAEAGPLVLCDVLDTLKCNIMASRIKTETEKTASNPVLKHIHGFTKLGL